jgi:hypothetical protein
MIGLTNDQRNRLMNAASRLTSDSRAKLSLAESQAISDRIDKVLYELHIENPAAFVTNAVPSLGGIEFTPNYVSIRRRKFYNEPLKVKTSEYATHEKPLPKERRL